MGDRGDADRIEETLGLTTEPLSQLLGAGIRRRRFLMASGALLGSVLLAACGGDDDDDDDDDEDEGDAGGAEPTDTPPPTQAPISVQATPTEEDEDEEDEEEAEPTATEAAAEPTATEEEEEEEEGTKIFRTAYGPDVASMDPAHITGAPDYQLGEAIYNFIGRYTYDPPLGTEIVPELAESWDISTDGQVYTFNIRQGVQFHRGFGELTAHDIVWNWERIKNEDTGSRYRPDFDGSTIEAVDDYTVQVTFEFSYPAFIPAALAFRPGMIISPAAQEELGEDWKTDPVGTGAFQWDEWQPGSFVRVSRFEDYWGEPANVDELFVRVKVDPRTSVLSVSTGELDAFYIDSPDVALDAQSNTPPNTVFMPSEFGQSPLWIAFNTLKPPLDDVRVRQALRYAIDEELIAEELFGGLADPISSFLPPFMFGFCDDVMKFPYDPDRARELLDEAGVPGDWKPVLLADSTSIAASIVVEAVGSFWQDIDVDVQIDLPERGIFLERRYAYDFDMFTISVGRIEPDQIATPYWTGGARVNQAQYFGADDLIPLAKSEADTGRRAELYCELQQRMAEDSPAAFIIATSSQLIVNERVSGIAGPGWQTRYDWTRIDVPAE